MTDHDEQPQPEGSRVGPWLLVDSPLGWVLRSEVTDLLREADQRLALAVHDTEQARYERDRLRTRKVIRVTNELSGTGSSKSVVTLPARLRRATGPLPPSREPKPPPPPTERVDAQRAGRRREPELRRPWRPPPRSTFSHLRVLHLGAAARFGSLTEHRPLDPDGWAVQLEEGADLLLVEPPAGAEDWDPLDGQLPALLQAARAAGIPSVRIVTAEVGTARSAPPGHATLELVESAEGDLAAGDGVIAPTVDTGLLNPQGLHLVAPDPVVALLGAAPDDVARHLLEGFDPPVRSLRPPDLEEVAGLTDHLVEDPTGLQQALVRAGVLLDHPGWRQGPTDRVRTWTAALACGTPVVAVDPGGLALPPGVVGADPDDAIEVAHHLGVDLDRRERLGIVGRRWALAQRTREGLLRALLSHLCVPVPAPLRTTVLLATHRPDFVARGLASVERQRQADVDVVLALHGEGFGDDPRSDRLSAVVRAPAAWLLGDVLNAALDRAGGDLVAKMDDDDHYGPEHLGDLVTAWGHSGADLVGKRVEYVHLADRGITVRRPSSEPERFRRHVGGPTLLGTRELLRRYRFRRVPNRVDSTLYERVLADGGRIYGIHSRDLVLERHGQRHAWSVEDDTFLDTAIDRREGLAIDFASSDPDAG